MLAFTLFLLSLQCSLSSFQVPHQHHYQRKQANPSLVSYQTHSFNSLANFQQNYDKGSRWFKVDPHFMPFEFCSKWDPSTNFSAKGCFLLTHDTPQVTYPFYNTSEELLVFLQNLVNNNNAHQNNIVSNNMYSNNNDSDTLYIAFCFKYDYGSPCIGNKVANQRAQNWIDLVDDFYVKCNNLSQQLGVNLQWIMDGAGTSGGSERSCLIGRWPLWPATWILGNDPIEALDSNDKAQGLDRFQINNMKEGNSSYPTSPLDLLRAHSPPFGKFLESSAPGFPFLLWEPDSQVDILKIARNYLQGPLSPGGFRFAANIDPVQLSIYASRASQPEQPMILSQEDIEAFSKKQFMSQQQNSDYWNFHLSSFFQNASSLPFSPRITSPSNQPVYFQQQKGRPIILTWQETNTFIVQLCRILTQGFYCGKPQKLAVPIHMHATSPTTTQFSSWSSVTTTQEGVTFDIILAGTTDGHYVIYRIGDNETLLVLTSGSLAANGSTMSLVASPNLVNVSILHIYSNSSDSCALSLATFPLVWRKNKFIPFSSPPMSFSASPSLSPQTECNDFVVPTSLRDLTTCVAPRALLPPNGIIVSASIEGTGVGCGLQVMGLVAFSLVVPSSDSLLFANSFLINDPFLGKGADIALQSPSQIGVGSSPVVSVSGTPLGPMGPHPALIVTGESYCYNSHQHNIRAVPGVCEQDPVAIPNVLTYSLADLTTWLDFLDNSDGHANLVNSCTSNFQHGMYDMGTFPSAVLYINEERVGIAALHVGINRSSVDVAGCGLAESYEGLVLDGWIGLRPLV